MAGRDSVINPAANDENSTKSSMMDLWRESIERAKTERAAPVQVAKSEHEARAELEQRIRNGQAQCPTCASRRYQDESDDGGVSYKAPKGISSSTAGIAVTGHEHEHVAEGDAESERAEGGAVKSSTVALEYAKCPECGKTYVKGGVTKTTTQPYSYRKKSGGLDVEA